MPELLLSSAQPIDAATGRHRRSSRAARTLALAEDYDRLRRELWAAAGPEFRARVLAEVPEAAADDGAFVTAARECDRGFRLTRDLPGVARELAAARRARDRLALANRSMVSAIARRLAGETRRADARQAGFEALLVAVDRFDPARGWAFSTFAGPHVAGAVRGVENAAHAARLPSQSLSAWKRADAERERAFAETGSRPSWREIVECLGWPASRVAVVEGVERAFRPARDDFDVAAGDALPDEAAASAEVLSAVRAAVAGAPDAERLALEGLAGMRSASLDRLAKEAGVPRSAAPEIRRRAVERARHTLEPVACAK